MVSSKATATCRPGTCAVEAALDAGASLAGVAGAFLIIALRHDGERPELDWWGGPGGTPGNRELIRISKRVVTRLRDDFGLKARDVPYQTEKGGILLKDAAVTAGLGTIGKNNLLITPEFGPRVRLRAVAIEARLDETGPRDFFPCVDCEMPCRRACPLEVFHEGSFDRKLCFRQMHRDEVCASERVKYCRECELACPVGSCGEAGSFVSSGKATS